MMTDPLMRSWMERIATALERIVASQEIIAEMAEADPLRSIDRMLAAEATGIVPTPDAPNVAPESPSDPLERAPVALSPEQAEALLMKMMTSGDTRMQSIKPEPDSDLPDYERWRME